MTKAVVWIQGNDGAFGIRVVGSDVVSQVQKILKHYGPSTLAGEHAVSFARDASAKGLKPVMAQSLHNGDDYSIHFDTYNGHTRLYNVVGRAVKTRLYNGNINMLAGWSSARSELDKAVGKLVRFTYVGDNGQETRVLKLESVTPGRKGMLLRGEDVNKRGFRAFDINKVVGEIEILS
jgi:hypothetical protein